MLTKEMFAGLTEGEQIVVTYDNEKARGTAHWKKRVPRAFEAIVCGFRPFYLLERHLRVVVKPRGYFFYRPSFVVNDPVIISKGWPSKSITSLGERLFEWLEKTTKGYNLCT